MSDETDSFDDSENDFEDEWYRWKEGYYREVLGQQEDLVQHALIPYDVGGALDLYFYSGKIPGTAMVTMELSPSPEEGSSNDLMDRYEFVMFSRYPFEASEKTDSPFQKTMRDCYPILNLMGRYSEQATLNPCETVEFPEDMEDVGGRCLILNAWGEECQNEYNFGLMLIMEVHRSEMNFAREHGPDELFMRLDEAGYYPYSDMDRESVV